MSFLTGLGFFKKKSPLKIEHFDNWYSSELDRDVIIDVYLPPGHKKDGKTIYPLLVLNDGQDLPRMQFFQILEQLFTARDIPPFIAVGLHANADRMHEYGTVRQVDYKGRGRKAPAFKAFVMSELIPFVRQEYGASSDPSECFYAGFSLGGLSALDIAWSEPETFGGAGVFSGALWWRWSDVDAANPDADRIMHDIIQYDNEKHRPNNQFFWFQAGTMDEEDDRNNNGIIDAIDDTLACIEVILERGYHTEQVRYLEIKEGTHDPETWGRAMPDFLNWIFNRVGGGLE